MAREPSLYHPVVPKRSRALLLAAAVLGLIAAVGRLPASLSPLVGLGLALLVVACATATLWHANPTWVLASAAALTPFAAHWQLIGIPGALSPDRLLLIAGLAAIVLRAPQVRGRPKLRVELVHWVLVVALAYALVSGLSHGTLNTKASVFELFQRFGVIPFALFFIGPAVLRTAKQRNVVTIVMTGLGTYLGLVSVLQTLNANSVIFPRYIGDPANSLVNGRAGGPFLDAVSNGAALFACALVAGLAVMTWEGRWARRFAMSVAGLDIVGCLLTLERSVWLGTVAGLLVVVLGHRALRRRLIPILVVGVAVTALTIVVVPGLQTRVTARANDRATVWDRQNLDRSGLNMIRAHPLGGVGWNRFVAEKANYAQQSDSYPLTAGGQYILHNLFLSYGSQLGLIGLTLWVLGAGLAVGGALLTRGPPGLRMWQVALASYAVFFTFIGNFVFPQLFPVLMLWLFAAIPWSSRLEGLTAIRSEFKDADGLPLHGPERTERYEKQVTEHA